MTNHTRRNFIKLAGGALAALATALELHEIKLLEADVGDDGRAASVQPVDGLATGPTRLRPVDNPTLHVSSDDGAAWREIGVISDISATEGVRMASLDGFEINHADGLRFVVDAHDREQLDLFSPMAFSIVFRDGTKIVVQGYVYASNNVYNSDGRTEVEYTLAMEGSPVIERA